MNDRIFLSSTVAHIVGITGRQVLSWTEKGIIRPSKDSTGTGVRREYDYINLLEFGLCKKLYSIGLNFRSVKAMVSILRENGIVKSWAEDFQTYYLKVAEQHRKTLEEIAVEIKDDPEKLREFREIYDQFLNQRFEPEQPEGVLVYFFDDGINNFDVRIYPWESDYVVRLNELKDGFSVYGAAILIDIGKIKREIDKRL